MSLYWDFLPEVVRRIKWSRIIQSLLVTCPFLWKLHTLSDHVQECTLWGRQLSVMRWRIHWRDLPSKRIRLEVQRSPWTMEIRLEERQLEDKQEEGGRNPGKRQGDLNKLVAMGWRETGRWERAGMWGWTEVGDGFMGRAQEVASQGWFSDFWFVKVNGWWVGCPLRQET